MIFYFSGTGNSLWVAKQLAIKYNDKLISISEELMRQGNDFTYDISLQEKVFFVFPVHSWGPDVLTFRFLNKVNFVNYQSQNVFMICTCGDNCGYTNKIVKAILAKKSIQLTKAYSMQMPNNYILMKVFSTDSKEVEARKLKEAPILLQQITEDIHNNSKKNIYKKGMCPILKSHIIYPLFRKYAIEKNYFHAENICISCGLCIDICPTKTIYFDDKKPKWNKNTCVQCSACINRCPVRAVEYGEISQKKGRYHHPDI